MYYTLQVFVYSNSHEGSSQGHSTLATRAAEREKKVNNVDILDVNREERVRIDSFGRICMYGSHLGNNERGVEGVKDEGRPRKS